MPPHGDRMQVLEAWYIAGRSRDLQKKPLTSTILGQELVLFRLSAGRVGALTNQCAHRNMPLSAGRVEGEGLRCTYHGWKYSASGTCIDVPSLPDPGRMAGAVLVRSYPVVESQGFVWVYMGQGEPRGGPFQFPHYGEKTWTSFCMTTRFEASASSCLENFLDVSHTTYVHRGWFRSRRGTTVRARVRKSADGVKAEFLEEPEVHSVAGRLLAPPGGRPLHTDRFIVPNISRVDYRFGGSRHFIITSQCTPMADDQTMVYTVVTFRCPALAPLIRLLFEALSRFVIKQDVEVLRQQTRQIRLFGGPQFLVVDTDLMARSILEVWRRAPVDGLGSPHEDYAEREVLIQF